MRPFSITRSYGRSATPGARGADAHATENPLATTTAAKRIARMIILSENRRFVRLRRSPSTRILRDEIVYKYAAIYRSLGPLARASARASPHHGPRWHHPSSPRVDRGVRGRRRTPGPDLGPGIHRPRSVSHPPRGAESRRRERRRLRGIRPVTRLRVRPHRGPRWTARALVGHARGSRGRARPTPR